MPIDHNYVTEADGSTPGGLGQCSSCAAISASDARFCPQCGAARSATQHTWAQSVPEEVTVRRWAVRRNLVIGASGLGVLLAVGVIAGIATAESASDKQLTQSATDLTAVLDTLAAAQSTADIRAAADSVEAAATQTANFVETLPADDMSSALSDVSEALLAIASLSDVSGERPDAWSDAEEPIRDLADAQDPVVAELTALSEDAADQIDRILDDATEAYDEWAAENAEAVAERDASIAGATSYMDQMNGLLEAYASLRGELSAYIEVVDTQGSTIEEAYRQFASASQARRDLRDQMTSLTPPDGAGGEHDRLLAIIDDGIAGVEAAERALDQRECTFYGCQVVEQPAWQQFLSESKRISSSFGEATTAWQSSAQAAIEEARAIELPDQPQF